MPVYYNDIDPKACTWLQQLVLDGLLPKGDVDCRDIREVKAEDLKGYHQLHFFAGIGGWPLSLQMAGWPEDRPVVSGSLPCQPFSAAGKQLGKKDERHLLPHFLELVEQCDWPILFGEQVPAAIKHGWLDDLQSTMGAQGYTTGAVVLTAAGVGAPHIRQRLYWLASRLGHPQCDGHDVVPVRRSPEKIEGRLQQPERPSAIGGMGDPEHNGCNGPSQPPSDVRPSPQGGQEEPQLSGQPEGAGVPGNAASLPGREVGCSQWSDTDWIYCRDGKYRPIPKGIQPLARKLEPGLGKSPYGLPGGVVQGGNKGFQEDVNNTLEARVMRLKGYGNAICVPVAVAFIEAFLKVENDGEI